MAKTFLALQKSQRGVQWSAIKLRYRADGDGDGDDNDDNNDDHFDWVQQLAIKLQYRSEDERLCDNLTLLSPNTWLRRTIRGQPGQLESCEVRLGRFCRHHETFLSIRGSTWSYLGHLRAQGLSLVCNMGKKESSKK